MDISESEHENVSFLCPAFFFVAVETLALRFFAKVMVSVGLFIVHELPP